MTASSRKMSSRWGLTIARGEGGFARGRRGIRPGRLEAEPPQFWAQMLAPLQTSELPQLEPLQQGSPPFPHS
jgi:hypothetical protein